ncbi:streptophobe family protein [Streptomyces sp. NPDC001508]|uniref:streptophobe family protein n=1 Tax=Streptomyces sp. NPDC001508 TaxID=3154656 RepID=UPI0033183ED9
MSTATHIGTERHGGRLPWADVLLSAITAVSWALIGMAGTAALGLHLLRADSAGSLGPMTAAVVALGAGGSLSPSGDLSAFGLKGAQAHTAVEITPLGVSLVGALLLSWFFLRSLRAAGVVIAPPELLARAGAVVALFVAMLGGLARAGHDVVTIDGGALGLDRLPGTGGGDGGGLGVLGLGDLGDVGGLLPDRIGDLIDAKAAVGFTVDTAPTLLGGLGWSAGVLLIALLASRRAPLPRGFDAVHRVVRPAVSALVGVLVVAVVAGLAAAAYAAIGDEHPRRIAGAALLGAPNGVWLGVPLGLFVPFDGRATGALTAVLPDPLDRLLAGMPDRPVTLGRLAELDGRVWLLGVAAALMMLSAGVLTAVRTPTAPRGVRGAGGSGTGGSGAVGSGAAGSGTAEWGAAGSGIAGSRTARSGDGAAGSRTAGSGAPGSEMAGSRTADSGTADSRTGGSRVAGSGTARFGAGVVGPGAGGSGAVGSEAGGVRLSGAGGVGRHGFGVLGFAGRCALRLGAVTALALPLLAWLADVSVDASLSVLGLDALGAGVELHGHLGTALLLGAAWGAGAGAAGAVLAWVAGAAGRQAAPLALGEPAGGTGRPAYGHLGDVGGSGPYTPRVPYRPPNPGTNPYLRLPDELRNAGGSGPLEAEQPRPPAGPPPADDVYDATTVTRPLDPPPRPRYRPGDRPADHPDNGPPPPPAAPPGQSGGRN